MRRILLLSYLLSIIFMTLTLLAIIFSAPILAAINWPIQSLLFIVNFFLLGMSLERFLDLLVQKSEIPPDTSLPTKPSENGHFGERDTSGLLLNKDKWKRF